MFLASAACASVAWFHWFRRPLTVNRTGASDLGLALLYFVPVVAASIVAFVLLAMASADVRNDWIYLAFYFVLGAAWMGGAAWCLPVAGISARDDVMERANDSASIAVAGALIGFTLCFAGGNVGDGPGWWVVVFSAGLASLGLFAAWLALEWMVDVSDGVTIERDIASGIRLAGFLVAVGLVFGRSVAGDWMSVDATMADFVTLAWPVVLMVPLAAVVERKGRPSVEQPSPSIAAYGLLPALAYLLIATLQVLRAGPPA